MPLLEPDFRSSLVLATLEDGMCFWTPSLLYEPVHPTQSLLAFLASPPGKEEQAWLLSRVLNELDSSQVPEASWRAFQEAIVRQGRPFDSWLLLKKGGYHATQLLLLIVENHSQLALIHLLLELLSKQMMRPNARSVKEETALHIAARRRNVGMVLLLLAHGADPNAADGLLRTALHYGCHNHIITLALLSYGAKVWVTDMYDQSAADVCRSPTAAFLLTRAEYRT